MGASFALGDKSAPVLALLIGLQNIPEGFNSFREIRNSSKISASRLIAYFSAISLCGPLSTWIGFSLLKDSPFIVGGISLGAAAGILYLTFQDIAPQAKLENKYAPSLGAVAGFMCGMVSKVLLG